ncbi:MAG: hypothetical protein IKV86_05750 [Clostridia bacterium]|nr:hypothetical protein [Clostridia bacterium]
MHYKDIINDRFIKPLLNKKTGTIGVELEFPMLNTKKEPVDKNIALSLLDMFLENGFKTEDTDTEGNPAFVTNEHGDCVSFDNSYNNIEFSMNYADNLNSIKERFCKYFNLAQDFLKEYGYIITGMGTNPYKKYINQDHVSYPVYNMVDEYLHKFQSESTHQYPDFPSYLSSVQTHLDIDVADLPKAATLFAKIDFLRGLLFSNSPDFEFGKTLCYRDQLWAKSAFGICGTNTGAVDEEYKTLDDIAESFYKRHMFNCIRNGEYQSFYPVKITEYFKDNPPEDINQFLSFRHIEITCRGTLEIRSDCTQPLCDAFAPPAFNLGIAHNLENAIQTTEEFFKGKVLTNSHLRRCVSEGLGIKEFSKSELCEYAIKMVETATEGLVKRGLGEEGLIKCLLKRAEALQCPAMYTLENLDDLDSVIKKYAEF